MRCQLLKQYQYDNTGWSIGWALAGHLAKRQPQYRLAWPSAQFFCIATVRKRTDPLCPTANNEHSPVEPLKSRHDSVFNVDLEKFVMKLQYRVVAGLSAVLLVASIGLSGCAGMTRQEQNTATGAVVGGVVGNVLCGGVLCTAAGAAAGGVIGHEVGR